MHRFTLVLLLLAVAIGPAVAIKCKAYMGDGLSTPADTPEAECASGVTMCYRAHQEAAGASATIAGCHLDGTCETFNAGVELAKALVGGDGKCSTCDTDLCNGAPGVHYAKPCLLLSAFVALVLAFNV